MLSRIEKCKVAIKKGYTYDKETGFIFGLKGNVIKRKCDGYVVINLSYNKKSYNLYGHQFAWFCIYGNFEKEIDHINGIRNDNRILNLRSITHQQNNFNKKSKGVYFQKDRNKWMAKIKINGKQINLGRFETELKAKEAYFKAKEKYHKIE